eukprot:scaffold613835_cov18-Prasinocladus_malaysianus.AAC.1
MTLDPDTYLGWRVDCAEPNDGIHRVAIMRDADCQELCCRYGLEYRKHQKAEHAFMIIRDCDHCPGSTA